MKYSSSILEDAVLAMNALPSVGKKTALRLILHLLKDDTGKVDKIVQSLQDLKTNLKTCNSCFNYSDNDICDICLSPERVKTTICVVESVRDVMAIEDTDQFRGQYHVLGGVISPLNGIGQEQLNMQSLFERIAEQKIEEVILALSPTVDGDTTSYYISKNLETLDVKISTIARGVSFGGELEYADEITLGRSILARTPYSLNID